MVMGQHASMQKIGAYNRGGLGGAASDLSMPDRGMGVYFDPETEKAMKEEAAKPWWQDWVKSLEIRKIAESYTEKMKEAKQSSASIPKTFHPSQPAYPMAKAGTVIESKREPKKTIADYVPYFVIGGLGVLGLFLVIRK